MNLMKRNMSCSPRYYNYFDDLFGANFPDLFFSDSPTRQTMPSVNICEHEKEFTLELAAPGYSKDNFKINLSDNIRPLKQIVRMRKRKRIKSIPIENISTLHLKKIYFAGQHRLKKDWCQTYDEGILHIHLPKKEVNKEEISSEIVIK